jgi:hypothetical protein
MPRLWGIGSAAKKKISARLFSISLNASKEIASERSLMNCFST